MHHLKNLKYWPYTMYSRMGSHTSMVSRKNTTVINFAQSHGLINFSCIVSKIQKTSHSQCIGPWEVVRARFHEEMQQS
ncbi:hypothetical protein B296_00001442 [Ensete ventricosum]|uniref:Uncharacterized protein n=1 Tax=Ensete ventricosum TaxID=4639 RepID=A0A427B4V2_ENSVE|nr:hypothetical protein B296_00001442 [Ensete ventricosum]